MKKNWLLLICLIVSIVSFSQQGNFVTNDEYSSRKANGTLIGDEIILSEGMVNPNNIPNSVNTLVQYSPEKATGCSGYFDPPGPAYNITWGTDDGSSPVINLPFTFCFFGDSYTSVYMNNNGNISFQNSISTFSSSAFPSTGNKMIAAFWADFDFGGCGEMYATVTPTAAIFNWVDAGYYSSECDKKNTCQIVITNGSDPLIAGGNVAIHFNDMSWTTGSASSGVNGFGGTAATVGANRGNNLDYFQLGRFDHAGTDYDGPNLLTDGVDFLDNKSYFFDFCLVTNGNISPIPTNSNACDTLNVCQLGDTLDVSFPFIAPENNQITTVTYSTPTLSNVQVLSNTSGYTGVLNLRIIGALETIGVHDIIVTGTDNASTPGITTVTYKIKVNDPGTAFLVEPVLSFTPGCAPVTIGINNNPYDEFYWSNNGSINSTTVINSAFNDTLKVTVYNGGCAVQIDTLINIPGATFFNLQGSLSYCPDLLSTHLFLPDSVLMDSVHWVLNSTSTLVSTDFSPDLVAGTYTATIWSLSSLCSKDTTFTISSQPNLVLGADQSICTPTYQFVGNVGGVGTGTWSVLGSPTPSPTFSNNNLNPLVTFNGFGTYSLIYTESGCADKDTVDVTWNPSPVFNFPNTFVCPGNTSNLEIPDSLNMSSMTWGLSNPSLNTLFSANLNIGNYSLHLVHNNGCFKDTNLIVTTQPAVVLNIPSSSCDPLVTMTTNTGGSNNGTNGTWTSTGGTGLVVFGNSNNINTTMTFPGYGTYQVTYTDDNCLDNDVATIIYSPKPIFDLVNDFFYCPSEQGVHYEIEDSLTMTSMTWGISGAQNTLFSANLIAGTYSPHLVNNFGCFSDTTFTVTTQLPVTLNIVPSICLPATSLTMSANTGGSGNGTWSYTGGTGTVSFGNANTLNTTLNFTGSGTYQLIYTDNICPNNVTSTIVHSDKPYFNLGDDFFYCPTELGLHLEIPDSLDMSSMTWGITGPGNTLFSATLSGAIGTGTAYSVHLVNEYNCFNDTTFTVTTQIPVALDYNFHTSNNGLCVWKLDTTYQMYQNTGEEPGTWTYTGPTGKTVTFDEATELNPKIQFSDYGDYYLIYTEPTCNDDDTLLVRVIPAASYFDIGEKYHKLCTGNLQEISVNAVNINYITSWVWSNGETTESIVVNEQGWYKLTIETECPNSDFNDSTFVEVKICDIDMPNVFSPNGDGVNDTYKIKGDTEIFKEFNIVIVNRWGNLIKEYSDPLGIWDGTDNSGDIVSSGVYFYSVNAVTLQDQPLVKDGFIHVIKE